MRLRYLFWAMATFLVGCGPQTVLSYRWDVLGEEMPTAHSGRGLFGEPRLASDNIYGTDEIAGVNLNQRSQRRSTAGYVRQEEVIHYYMVYDDDRYDTWEHTDRSFHYHSAGTWYRDAGRR